MSERDTGMLNTMKLKHFLHRCWNIYLQKTKKRKSTSFFSVARAQSLWHNWTNSTESIYVDFGYQSAEPLYFHPFTIYAFYLYDFLFTKLQIFFCFVYHLRDRYLSLLWWVRRVLFFSSSSFFVSYICLLNSDCCVCSLQIVVKLCSMKGVCVFCFEIATTNKFEATLL